MTRISSPKNSVLVLGRTLVENDADISAAYALSKQIHLTPSDADLSPVEEGKTPRRTG